MEWAAARPGILRSTGSTTMALAELRITATRRAEPSSRRCRRWGGRPKVTVPIRIFACLPVPAGVTAAGVWVGTTSNNETVRAIVLVDGTSYILYSRPGNATDAAVIQGSGAASAGSFSSTDGKHFPIAGASETNDRTTPASFTGTYVPQGTLQLTVTDRRGTHALTATYAAGSGWSPSLAAAAGTYSGFAGHVDGRQSATFTLDVNGNLSGANGVCQFSANVSPRNDVAALRLDRSLERPFLRLWCLCVGRPVLR